MSLSDSSLPANPPRSQSQKYAQPSPRSSCKPIEFVTSGTNESNTSLAERLVRKLAIPSTECFCTAGLQATSSIGRLAMAAQAAKPDSQAESEIIFEDPFRPQLVSVQSEEGNVLAYVLQPGEISDTKPEHEADN